MSRRTIAMKQKHDAVYNLYLQYTAEIKRDNPLMASYLPISYFAEIIAQLPEICLTAEYVQKIIRKRIKSRNKMDVL